MAQAAMYAANTLSRFFMLPPLHAASFQDRLSWPPAGNAGEAAASSVPAWQTKRRREPCTSKDQAPHPVLPEPPAVGVASTTSEWNQKQEARPRKRICRIVR